MPNDGIPIPASRRAICVFCGITVDSAAMGTWEYVFGWCENRKAGGAHYPALIERQKRYACNTCIDRLKHGVSPAQKTLWE